MSLQKQKIILAPVLAIVLALLLVGATASFPPAQQEQTVLTQGIPTAQPGETPPSMPSTVPSPILGSTPLPSLSPSIRSDQSPDPVIVTPTSSSGLGSMLQLLFIIAAIAVAVVSVRVLFAENDPSSQSLST